MIQFNITRNSWIYPREIVGNAVRLSWGNPTRKNPFSYHSEWWYVEEKDVPKLAQWGEVARYYMQDFLEGKDPHPDTLRVTIRENNIVEIDVVHIVSPERAARMAERRADYARWLETTGLVYEDIIGEFVDGKLVHKKKFCVNPVVDYAIDTSFETREEALLFVRKSGWEKETWLDNMSRYYI